MRHTTDLLDQLQTHLRKRRQFCRAELAVTVTRNTFIFTCFRRTRSFTNAFRPLYSLGFSHINVKELFASSKLSRNKCFAARALETIGGHKMFLSPWWKTHVPVLRFAHNMIFPKCLAQIFAFEVYESWVTRLSRIENGFDWHSWFLKLHPTSPTCGGERPVLRVYAQEKYIKTWEQIGSQIKFVSRTKN